MKEYIIQIPETANNFEEFFVGHMRKSQELIRCKDCTHWHTSYCPMAYLEYELGRGNEPMDFCSLAERKDEYVTLRHEDIHFIDEDAERAFYESLAERKK